MTATFNEVSDKHGWGLKLVLGPLDGIYEEGWQLREIANGSVLHTYPHKQEHVAAALAADYAMAGQH